MAFWLWLVCILVCVGEGVRNFVLYWTLLVKMGRGLVEPFNSRDMAGFAVFRTLGFVAIGVAGTIIAQRIGGAAPLVALALLVLWGWRSANSARGAYVEMYLLVMSRDGEE
jgi:hypothetical protein